MLRFCSALHTTECFAFKVNRREREDKRGRERERDKIIPTYTYTEQISFDPWTRCMSWMNALNKLNHFILFLKSIEIKQIWCSNLMFNYGTRTLCLSILSQHIKFDVYIYGFISTFCTLDSFRARFLFSSVMFVICVVLLLLCRVYYTTWMCRFWNNDVIKISTTTTRWVQHY